MTSPTGPKIRRTPETAGGHYASESTLGWGGTSTSGYGNNYPGGLWGYGYNGPPLWAQADRQQMAMMYGHAMNNAYRPYVPPEDKIDNTGREG